MSGDARITGRITVTPPIMWRELADNRWALCDGAREGGGFFDAKVHVDHNDVDTDDGVLSVRVGTAIVAAGGETNGYNLTEDVDRIARQFATAPDRTARTFAGYLHVVWGGGDEVYRVHVVDGHAVEARPRMVWPDGARDEDEVK